MITIDQILEKAKTFLPTLDGDRVRSAYEYVDHVHRDSYRFSGDSSISHLLAVTDILLALRPDENTIIASLMHDLSESPNYNLKEVISRFGGEVGQMVAVLEKINNLHLRSSHSDLETLRKMFLAVASDLRVVFIRLADRLHNMETLEYVQVSKRKGIASETLGLYVPIASRLGLYQLKCRLEDLCFQYLYPQQYLDVKLQLEQYLKKQEKVIDSIKKELEDFLAAKGVEAQVEGRLKNLYSIYKKLKKKSRTSVNDVFDIFAFRIILPTRLNKRGEELTDHLYAILGLLHSRWVPLANRFKDYIAVPKPNGYRSLHIAVVGLTPKPLNQPTEIQIRSRKMHEEADFGIAAHWLYKELKGHNVHDFSLRKVLAEEDSKHFLKNDWVTALARLYRDLGTNRQSLKPLKLNLFEDRIFVLTPQGDVKDLPKGSTPIDFAYALHTDLGHRCCGAKVNHVIVPFNYQLKNGETVEILTKSKPDPKPHWLSFLKTAHARSKVKSYFKSLDTEQSFREGRQLLNKALEQLGYPVLDDNLTLLKKYDGKKFSLRDRCKLLEDIGNGTLLVGLVVKKIFGSAHAGGLPLNKEAEQTSESKITDVNESSTRLKPILSNQLFIAGEADLPYKLSSCCKPTEGSPIIAYVARGRALRIHLQNCKLLKNVDQQRTLEAHWGGYNLERQRYSVKIMVRALDRVGLIRDIADVVSGFNVNILDFSLQERMDNVIQREMVLEVMDQQQFEKIMNRLQQIRNVIKVTQTGESLNSLNG